MLVAGGAFATISYNEGGRAFMPHSRPALPEGHADRAQVVQHVGNDLQLALTQAKEGYNARC